MKKYYSVKMERWCLQFGKLARHSMPSESVEYLCKLMLLSNKLDNDPEFKDMIEADGTISLLISKRIKSLYEYKMTLTAIALLSELSTTPSIAVMYLTYFQWYCYKNSISKVDLDLICDIFGDGFPIESDLRESWNSQKIPESENGIFGNTDNMLDDLEAIDSIRSTPIGR